MSAKIPVKRVKDTKGSKEPSPPGKDTIYVDVDDEITAIIDKVEAAKGKIVALVLPKRANALQSVVNMRLLKRSADNASKNLVLVSSEPALLPLAGAVGIHIAKDLQSVPEIPPSPLEATEPDEAKPESTEPAIESTDEADINPEDAAKKIDYKKSIGELAAAHGLEDDAIELNEPEEELPKAAKVSKQPKAGVAAMSKKLKVPNFERFRLLLFGGIALLIAFIIFIIFAILVLPKGTVTISTTSLPVSANLTLDASDKFTALDEAKSQIPASLKATKQTSNQTVNATGQLNQGDKATGTIKFYNCNTADTLSGTNHTVPAGTGVSAGGLTYITQQSATVEPSHYLVGVCQNDKPSSSVNVKAQNGGAKYNQAATSYSVSGFSTISGSGLAMTGGTDNNVTIISQADVDGAKAKVTSANSDSFTKTFEQQLSSQGFYVLTSTLKLSDPVVTANPAVGAQATSTVVNIEITYSVMAIKNDDLKKVITDSLTKQVDKAKQKLSNENVLNGVNVSVQNQTAPAAATLTVNEDTTAIPIIDVNQVKTLAVGKKSGDIKTAISAWPGVKTVDVKFSPFWVSKAPKASKITVKIQQVKD